MKTFKKILCTLLVVVMCLTSAPLQGFVGMEWPSLPEINFGDFKLSEFDFSKWFSSEASALALTGQCGEKAIFNLYENGDLVISGTGYVNTYPWKKEDINIKKVTVEYGIEGLGDYIFAEADYLCDISLPNTILYIGLAAFNECNNLANLYYNGTIEDWLKISFTYYSHPILNGSNPMEEAKHTYFYGEEITEIVIPQNVKNIEYAQFAGLKSLKKLIIPNSVEKIGICAFSHCSSLVDLTICDGVKKIDNHAFELCKMLKKIVIPGSVGSVGRAAFQQCTNLRIIKLIDGVTYLDRNAFSLCEKLERLIIPDTIKFVIRCCFSGCLNLRDVYYSGSEDLWDLIKIEDTNECLTSANIYYNSLGPDNITKNDIVFEGGNDYYIYTGSMDLLKNGEYGFYTTDLYAKLYSYYLTSDDVEWTCSDETILKIIHSGGYYDYERKYYNLSLLVEGLKPGTVTITATASDGTTEDCTITVMGSNSYFKVESVNSTNSIPVDASIPLYVSLFKNGTQTSTKKIYSLSFDNSGIFEVESATTRSNVHGAFFDLVLKAKKEGVTNLTISDSDTGAYITVKLTAYKKINVYYFDNVPSKEYQKDRLTNFYNYNGLCIDGFYYTEFNSNNNYYVNMNAYNAKHHYGVAVSYDKNGKIYDFELLEPFKEYKTTFVENLAETYYSVRDTAKLFGDKYYYTGDSISKYTHVYLEVPRDGYAIVTNNCGENELAYLVNMIEYYINIALSVASASIGMVEKGELVKELSENIVKDLIELGLIQTVQTYASSLSKNFSYKNINNNISEFSEAMKKLDLDIVKIVTDAINLEFGISVAESAIWSILPTGKIIEMMMAFNDACNAVLHADNFAKSYDAPQIILYPPLNNDDVYESNGVIVNPEKELSPDYVLHSYVVAENNQVAVETDSLLREISDEYKLYNITLYKNGAETQPNGKIKVMIPIPSGYNKNQIEIYWYKEDGTLVSMNATVEGDYAVFFTDHLSYYIITDTDTESYPNIIVSGKCGINGDNLIWMLNSSGKLIIEGVGAMDNYKTGFDAPWYDYNPDIQKVLVCEEVTSIGDNAFSGLYRNLEEVYIYYKPHSEYSIVYIGKNAFNSWNEIREFYIPDSVAYIGDDAFYNCGRLDKINVDSNNQYFSSDDYGILYNKDKTTLIVCPEGVDEKNIDIPATVTTIYANAFTSSRISSIVIPKRVITIETNAFQGCNGLENVYFHGDESRWANINIADGNKNLLNAKMHFDAHTLKTVTISATCTLDGVEYVVCEDCGITIGAPKVLNATGHNYNNGVCTSCGDDLTANCSCNCHAGGIKGLIFKIILFFQKLFRMNRICEGCGVYHY